MIHILWPTIRPNVFVQMHKHWIERSSNKDIIKTHVAVNNSQDLEIIKNYDSNINTIIVNTKQIGVCYPSYKLSSNLKSLNDYDIIILASDDFSPPQDWDKYLINKLKGKEGCLMVRDGYQLPNSSNMQFPCITIPIMTYSCLRKINHVIYNPNYMHMYSDCELYLNLKEMGLLIDDRLIDTTTFDHMHYAAGKRNPDQFDRSYHIQWKDDEAMWNVRKNMPASERLKYEEN